MDLRKTPLYEMHKKYNGKIIDFAGFALPIQYKGIIKEHEAVRNVVGLFDVSHMGEIMITGNEAEKFTNYLVVNDVSKITDEQAMYTPMCYTDGGTVDDVLVYRYSLNKFMLVVNGANVDKDYEWILKQSENFEVDVKNISNDIAQIAIQGPKAVKVMESITDENINDIKYYRFKSHVNIKGTDCLVSRTGYTGEDGFELYIPKEHAITIWETLMEVGQLYDIQPAGLGCRDTLRFEAGLPLYGNELSESINPIEAGLGMFVKLDKDDFIGKQALRTYKENPKRKLVGFELLDKGVPRHGYTVENEQDEEIGYVTTGYKSPTLNKNIGFALIDASFGGLNQIINIKIRKNTVKAKIIKKRFLANR